MTDMRCTICGNPCYNKNWKEIKHRNTYELYCDNTECQKHYLIKFADCFLEDTEEEQP